MGAGASPARLAAIAPYFLVDDVVASATYYRKTLGFHHDRIWNDVAGPAFVIVRRDAVRIMLKRADLPAGGRPNRRVTRWAWDAYINVRGIDAIYGDLRARGAKIVRELETADYGMTDFEVEDDTGYILCFGEEAEK